MRGPIGIQLRFLGRFSAVSSEEPATTIQVSSRKGIALLAYLALQPNSCATREELATLLWGDRVDQQARHSLRQCLLSLRRDLGAAAQVFDLDGESVALRAEAISLDTRQFAELAESTELNALRQAADLYRGELLAGFTLDIETFRHWLEQERARLAVTAVGVLEVLVQQLDAIGEGRQAITHAERLVSIDPLREDWQRKALRLWARYRGRDAAVERANAVSALIKSELDVDPEPATQALIAEIRTGAPTPRASHAGRKVIGDLADRSEPAGIPPNDSKERSATVVPHASRVSARQPVAMLKPSRWPRLHPGLAFAAMAILGASAVVLGLEIYRRTILQPAQTVATSSQAIPNGAGNRPGQDGAKYPVPIVVAPFVMLGEAGASAQGMADAITENLITMLSRIPHLRVVSSQSAFSSRNTAADVATIAGTLNVQFGVEGSVRLRGDTVRIHAALVDAGSKLRLWTDLFELEQAHNHEIQDEIAKRLARQLQIQVMFAASRGYGREELHEISVEMLIALGAAAHWRRDSPKAMAYFEEALRRRPNYVPALTGVAIQLVVDSSFYQMKSQANFDRAEELLRRALAISPNDEISHHWLGTIQRHRRNYESALRFLEQALELNPSNVSLHGDIGYTLIQMGRPKEGLEQIQRAFRRIPKGLPTAGWHFFEAEAQIEIGEYGLALVALQRGVEQRPRDPRIHGALAATYALLGDAANAAKHVSELRAVLGSQAFQQLLDRINDDKAPAEDPQPRRREGLRLAIQGLSN